MITPYFSAIRVGGADLFDLSTVQSVTGQELRSAYVNPLFGNLAAGDLRLRSTQGRWTGTGYTNDTVTSLGIDFGRPDFPWVAEPPPNGGRINAGAFGNTSQASLTPPDPLIFLLTYREGGTLQPGNYLSWHTRGIASNETVEIGFTPDAGENWFTVAAGLPAMSGLYAFTNDFQSTRFARWRVRLESNLSLHDTSVSNFTFRNGPFVYYINDDQTQGNVFTSAPGNNDNLGILPSAPKRTLQAVINAYVLGAGDIVYVDTGRYTLSQPVLFTGLDSGTNGNPLVIRGSPQGAVFSGFSPQQGATVDAFQFNGAEHIRLENIRVRQMRRVWLNNARNMEFLGWKVFSNSLSGFTLDNSAPVTFEHTAVHQGAGDGIRMSGTSTGLFQHCVFWENAEASLHVAATARASVSNSVLASSRPLAFLYHAGATNSILANFNNLYVEGDALVGFVSSLGRNLDSHMDWASRTGQDRRSLSTDPLFANPGQGDFHLKTATFNGRFDPALGGFVTDPVTSPLIDAGDAAIAVTNEPAFHGGRVNIGLFGNTAEASRGRIDDWLVVGSGNQGGSVKGVVPLNWVASPSLTNPIHLVRIEVSTNAARTWTQLADNIPASTEQFLWNSAGVADSPAGLWRVSLVANPSVMDTSKAFFSVRNQGPLDFYVNDGVTNGSLYTSAAGSPTNWLASPTEPQSSLGRILSLYDMEPGDRVWVDAGEYNEGIPVRFGRRASGLSAMEQVSIVGAVQPGSEPATRLIGAGEAVIRFGNARFVSVSNLVVQGGQDALLMDRAQNISLTGLRAVQAGRSGAQLRFSTNIVLRNSVFSDNPEYGIYSFSNNIVRLQHSVSLSNSLGAVSIDGGAGFSVSNSVLMADGAGSFVYQTTNAPSIASDYNALQALNGAMMARSGLRIYRSSLDWRALLNNDRRSLTRDPLFFDSAAGDFHPLSQAGRFTATGLLVFDAVTSPLIDAGDPFASVGLEPPPNGGRLNVGLYGGTSEASRSPGDGWLLVLTANDGGTMRGTNCLYWLAGGATTGHLVYVEYSGDNGESWTQIATNLAASSGAFCDFDTTAFPPTGRGRWRVISQSNGAIAETNQTAFSIKNGPLVFYVNDPSPGTSKDVYTSVPGDPAFDGLSPDAPLPSLQAVLDAYTLSEGDLVMIDTGVYPMGGPLVLNLNTVGTLTNPVVFQGSTNYAAGGTVLNANNLVTGFQISGTEHLSFKDMTVTNAQAGFRLFSSNHLRFERINIVNPSTLFNNQQRGFEAQDSGNLDFSRVVIRGVNQPASAGLQLRLTSATFTSSNNVWRHGAMWDNSVGMQTSGDASIAVSNSIFGVFGPGRSAYQLGRATSLYANFNNYYLTNNARMGSIPLSLTSLQDGTLSVLAEHVDAWSRLTGQDSNSLSHDPLFAGESDYHLLSQGGRVEWGSTNLVFDFQSSPLIDAGDPGVDPSEEPGLNGGRINIGLYGNSAEASRTATNAGLVAVSLHDGGVAEGLSFPLYWVARGQATGHTLRIEASTNGTTWTRIIEGIPAGVTQTNWNTTTWPDSLSTEWRVVSEQDPSVAGRVSRPFRVGNAPFTFFVNDAQTNGNVYTIVAGALTNTGLSAASPLPSLQAVLSRYDLEPGDTVFIDTGVYSSEVPVVIGQLDTGRAGVPVTIQGSTNVSTGTRFIGEGLEVQGSMGLVLRHLEIDLIGTSTNAALRFFQNTNSVVEWVSVRNGKSHGILVEASVDMAFRHCAVSGFDLDGFRTVLSTDVSWDQGVIWSNRGNGVFAGAGPVSISNSVIGAFGAGARGFRVSGEWH